MGSVFARNDRLYLRYKTVDGTWTQRAAGLPVGREPIAWDMLLGVEAKIEAGRRGWSHDLDGASTTTVAKFAAGWAETRVHTLRDGANDKARLERYILPVIGAMPIDAVRPQHVLRIVDSVRAQGRAARTVRNVYSNLKALFRDAQFDELIVATPCILTARQLGRVVDKDPEWRSTAVYSREELRTLISDTRIPLDRRVFYALEGVGALRLGEVSGLRWRHLQHAKPLARLVVAQTYDGRPTKTDRPRLMPVHPVLAARLAEWKLSGWPKMMGRQPDPDDILLPTSGDGRTQRGIVRNKKYVSSRLRKDLLLLEMRHRRGHDLRRTFVTLARGDGARADVLELCTHTPGGARAIDLYTEVSWESRCAEVMKLRLDDEKAQEPLRDVG